MTQQTIAVIGANGKTGRRIVSGLRASGCRVRPLGRYTTPAFDWHDPTTWTAALHGVDACYVAFWPDLAVPGADEVIGSLAESIRSSGSTTTVLLSGRGEPGALLAESAIRAVLPLTTVLRCSFFAQNFSEGAWRDAVLAGTMALPVDVVPEPFVDVDDVAAVARAVLTTSEHRGSVLELTGPHLLTFAEAAEVVAEASGRPVEFTSVPLEAWLEGLRGAGEPPVVLDLMRHLFTEVLDGRNAYCTADIEKVLGRPATDFRTYAEHAAVGGAW